MTRLPLTTAEVRRMRRIDVPTIVGVVLGIFGLALVLELGITSALGLSSNATIVAAGVAFMGALFTLRLTLRAETSRATLPTTETKADLPVPGADVDDQLAEIDAAPLDTLDKRDELRERLTTIAVSQFTDQYGVHESEARDALSAGIWSDDAHAVAFFTGEYPEWAPLRLQIRDRSTFTRTPPSLQAEHVVDELAAIKNGEYERLHRAPAAGSEPDEPETEMGAQA
jgi:hypothetical protein